MEEEMGMREGTGSFATEDSHAAAVRRGPTWRGWVLSILVAVILSVAATLLLGGSSAFRPDRAVAGGGTGGGCGSGSGSGTGTGSSCCPPAAAGK